jgi:hypothetical protein
MYIQNGETIVNVIKQMKRSYIDCFCCGSDWLCNSGLVCSNVPKSSRHASTPVMQE